MKANERLKFIRESLKYSQKAFAERIGFNQSYLSEIERGKKQVTAKMANELFAEFKVPYNWLMHGEGDLKLAESDIAGGESRKKSSPVKRQFKLLKDFQGEEGDSSDEGRREINFLSQRGEEEVMEYQPPTKEELRKIQQGIENYRKRAELISNFSDKFKFELEKINPDLYKFRQDMIFFGDLVATLSSFYAKYFHKYSMVSLIFELSKKTELIENYTYQDFKKDAYKTLEDIENAKGALEIGNKMLPDVLKALKPFDTEEEIDDYLIDG